MFYKERKKFYIALFSIAFVCFIIQIIVIFSSDLSASFKNKNDEYWNNYYHRPYTRLHCYLMGLWLGCEYFRFKHDVTKQEVEESQSEDGSQENDDEREYTSMIHHVFINIKNQKGVVISMYAIAICLNFFLQLVHQFVNNKPDTLNKFVTFLYLVLSRPLFVISYVMMILPIILGND